MDEEIVNIEIVATTAAGERLVLGGSTSMDQPAGSRTTLCRLGPNIANLQRLGRVEQGQASFLCLTAFPNGS